MELLRRLQEWIKGEVERSGCRDWEIKETPDLLRPAHAKIAGRGRVVGPEPEDAAPERALEFTPPPSDAVEYCVSYGWNDESMALVDRLPTGRSSRRLELRCAIAGRSPHARLGGSRNHLQYRSHQ